MNARSDTQYEPREGNTRFFHHEYLCACEKCEKCARSRIISIISNIILHTEQFYSINQSKPVTSLLVLTIGGKLSCLLFLFHSKGLVASAPLACHNNRGSSVMGLLISCPPRGSCPRISPPPPWISYSPPNTQVVMTPNYFLIQIKSRTWFK